MSARLGIIGYPIGHSMSPVMFRAALAECDLDITYDAWEVAPENLEEFLAGVRNSEGKILGFNATVPHKEAVMASMDEVSAEAQRAGAVNTVVNDDGRLFGLNTDGAGFVRALREEAGFSFEGSRVLIIGAGGRCQGSSHGPGRGTRGKFHHLQSHAGAGAAAGRRLGASLRGRRSGYFFRVQ